MVNDGVFRSALIWVGVVVIGVGIYTQSIKKMMGSYVFGMFGIAGILLPDWDFFDRPVSQWCTPVTVIRTDSTVTPSVLSTSRFKLYPLRLVVYSSVYGYGFYRWWKFVSN